MENIRSGDRPSEIDMKSQNTESSDHDSFSCCLERWFSFLRRIDFCQRIEYLSFSPYLLRWRRYILLVFPNTYISRCDGNYNRAISKLRLGCILQENDRLLKKIYNKFAFDYSRVAVFLFSIRIFLVRSNQILFFGPNVPSLLTFGQSWSDVARICTVVSYKNSGFNVIRK